MYDICDGAPTMPIPARDLLNRLSLRPVPSVPAAPGAPTLAALTGQLSEFSGLGATAGLTMATRLVLDAQQQGEIAAWITPADRTFFPPDVAESGVDLASLVVVRIPDAVAAARSADRLTRSGAFGLLILDLHGSHTLPPHALARLAGLAQQHHTAIVFVTQKPADAASLGSLIALHGSTKRVRLEADAFTCALRIVKDKRRGPWTFEEVCRGPAGLR
jgi:recombination protein RecA